MRRAYVSENPHPVGERHNLDDAGDGAGYSRVHSKEHPSLRTFLETRGYYDLFLIDRSGEIVYTVFKKSDFATNLVTGEYKDTGLGKVFRDAIAAEPGAIVFDDFEPYAPSAGAAAAFVGAPITSPRSGDVIGVLALKIPDDQIYEALLADNQQAVVQGFLVGSDSLLRSDLPETEERETLTARYEIPELAHVAAHSIRTGEGVGYFGDRAFLATEPVEFFDARYTIVIQKNAEMAMAPVDALRDDILQAFAVVQLILLVPAMLIGRSMARPVVAVSSAMRRMVEGDLTVSIPGVRRGDEIGDLARHTDRFREQIAANRAMLADLDEHVGAVVQAASLGDLSKRVECRFENPTLNHLGDGVNQICRVVDSFVNDIDRVIGGLASGDLEHRIDAEYHGKFAALRDAVNATVESLSKLVTEIADSSAEMRGLTEQIASGSADLSGRTESQAASLEETAATMEEMSATVKSNAGSAQGASAQAAHASSQAEEGRRVVAEAVSAMDRISDSSGKISDIISVIDGIAFQTNLLALNAAVEAARAGAAGKGFAVVASEVRALAQQSADAARDIKALIEESGAQVADGVKLVSRTGDALGMLSSAIVEVEASIRDISRTTSEQTSGVDEISTTVSDLDEMTQQNASMAERSAANARTLKASAEHLAQLVSFFQGGRIAPAPPIQNADEAAHDARWTPAAEAGGGSMSNHDREFGEVANWSWAHF